MSPYEMRLDMLVEQYETLKKKGKLDKHELKLEIWIDFVQQKLLSYYIKEMQQDLEGA